MAGLLNLCGFRTLKDIDKIDQYQTTQSGNTAQIMCIILECIIAVQTYGTAECACTPLSSVEPVATWFSQVAKADFDVEPSLGW